MAQCIYQHMPNFYQLTESVKTLVLKVLRDHLAHERRQGEEVRCCARGAV